MQREKRATAEGREKRKNARRATIVEHQSLHGGDRDSYDGGRGARERKEKSTYDVRLQQQVGIKNAKSGVVGNPRLADTSLEPEWGV